MKTTGTSTTLADGKKLISYVAAAVAFCFLNCLVLRAQEYGTGHPCSAREDFSFNDKEEPEAILELEAWMLDFQIRVQAKTTSPKTIHDRESVRQINEAQDEHDCEPELETDSL